MGRPKLGVAPRKDPTVDDAHDSDLTRLRALYDHHDEQLRADFDRSLSLGDGVIDRWDRARRLGFGEGTSIYGSALLYGHVEVGCGTWIGPWVLLDGSGGLLTIGDHCSISAGVQLYTHDTVRRALSGGVAPQHRAPLEIGSCTYLGPMSIVVAGVAVGKHCVVGANSFVSDDVPDRTAVAGSPARPIGRIVGDGADAHVEPL